MECSDIEVSFLLVMLVALMGQYWMSAPKGERWALGNGESRLAPLRQQEPLANSCPAGCEVASIKEHIERFLRIRSWARPELSPAHVLLVAPSDMWWERVVFEPSNILQRLGVSLCSFIHESRYYLRLTYKLLHFHSLPRPRGLLPK